MSKFDQIFNKESPINKYINEQIKNHGKTMVEMASVALEHKKCMKKCGKEMKEGKEYEMMDESLVLLHRVRDKK